MRVALLIESDGPGGAEFTFLNLASELKGRGHTVLGIGPAHGSGWLGDQLRERRVAQESFRLRFPVDPLCILGIARVLRRHRIEIVHSHEFTMAVYGAVAAGLLGLPQVVTMHGGRGFAARRRRRIALRWALRRSRAVAVSAATRSHLAEVLDLPAERLTVIHNGVRVPEGNAARARAEIPLPPTTPLLLAIGNLYRVKGHDVLLRALGSLRRRRPDLVWHLAVAGRGREEEALRRLAVDQGVENACTLLGFREDVADWLAAADVYVMPSRSEGLPLALLEAMAAGKPVIASAVGGVPEVLQGELAAGLVPPEDPGALSAHIERLLEEPDLRRRLGDRARALGVERFGVGAMVDAYETLYRSELQESADQAG